MRSARRDGLGEILPLDVRVQPQKVVKHFYNPTERWDVLAVVEMAALDEEARAAGFEPGTVPPSDARSSIVLRRHHDLHYGPTYLNALAASTTRWAPQPSQGASRALACSAEGILIAFDCKPRCKVITAFRPDLPLRGVYPTTRDFALEAHRRWRSSVTPTTRRQDAETLSEALDSDQGDLLSAWRLATALGHTRGSAAEASRDRIAAAEARLDALGPDGRRALLDAIDADRCLDALADAILEGDDTEALDRLLALEDILAACLVLGDTVRAEQLAEEGLVRVSCAGPELLTLAAYAEIRSPSTSGVLSRFWREIGEEVVANTLRLAPPHEGPALPSPALPLLRQFLDATLAVMVKLIDSVRVPQPALSSRAHALEVHAQGTAAPGSTLRAFVVDRDHPTGEEVSDLLAREHNRWTFQGWRVEPDDEAVLVVVSGGHDAATPPSLDRLLADADASWQVDTAPLRAAR